MGCSCSLITDILFSYSLENHPILQIYLSSSSSEFTPVDLSKTNHFFTNTYCDSLMLLYKYHCGVYIPSVKFVFEKYINHISVANTTLLLLILPLHELSAVIG